jgi:hypothetical protein
MLVFYLSGVILSAYLGYRMYRHEASFDLHTRIGMIIGVAFFSWFAVAMILVHFKLHYKYEIRAMYESALKQRALLL